jgi:hypothetical protein
MIAGPPQSRGAGALTGSPTTVRAPCQEPKYRRTVGLVCSLRVASRVGDGLAPPEDRGGLAQHVDRLTRCPRPALTDRFEGGGADRCVPRSEDRLRAPVRRPVRELELVAIRRIGIDLPLAGARRASGLGVPFAEPLDDFLAGAERRVLRTRDAFQAVAGARRNDRQTALAATSRSQVATHGARRELQLVEKAGFTPTRPRPEGTCAERIEAAQRMAEAVTSRP